jgi:drug/metabolite transporter (DMT)-like permease
MRFLFAGIISIPFLLTQRNIKEIKGPLICSAVLMFSLQLQTMGLELTTLAKSGFLTVFYAIFTPLITYYFYKQKFNRLYWVLLLIALFGIMLLCEFKIDNINLGDIYTLISALGFSLHFVAVDKYAKHHPSVEFNFLQCFYMGIFGTLFALIYEGVPDFTPLLSFEALFTTSALNGFIVISIFSSLIAFSLQVIAQKGIPPHIVSLIFLMESIFAAIFGYIFFNEGLSPMAILGCFLVITSVALIPKFTRMPQE